MPASSDSVSVFGKGIDARLRGIQSIQAQRPILDQMESITDVSTCETSRDAAHIQLGHVLRGRMPYDWIEVRVRAANSLQEEAMLR